MSPELNIYMRTANDIECKRLNGSDRQRQADELRTDAHWSTATVGYALNAQIS